jgi:DNA relaxase NicK
MEAIRELRAGVDWFSGSYTSTELDYVQLWHSSLEVLRTLETRGMVRQERNLNGYRGISVGGSFVGQRDDGMYLQLSGGAADEWYDWARAWIDSPSRLDIQVTVWFTEPQLMIAQEHRDDARDYNASLPKARRRKIWFIDGGEGSDTLYIGGVHSPSRARIYNKHRQSELAQYKHAWRYEGMFRDELACKYAKLIDNDVMSREHTITKIVAQYCAERGINVCFGDDRGYVALPKIEASHTDVERRLLWLSRQVKPTIDWLRESGYTDRVLLALGLTDGLNVPKP